MLHKKRNNFEIGGKMQLNKTIVEQKDISNNALMSYIGIVLSFKRNQNSILTNKNMIYYYLTDDFTPSRRMEENIREGIEELIRKKILVCKKKNGLDYYFGFKNVHLDDGEQFVLVDQEDIRTIMISDHKNKAALLRFYVCLCGTFISKNHISDIRNPEKYNNLLGMMSQEYIAEKCGLSLATVVDYFKILEEYKIIHVARCSFKFKDKNGQIKRHNNIYGRYINQELIDEFADIRYSMYDDLHKVQESIAVNQARSLMQKYNHLRGGTKYDDKTVSLIYNYILDYNNKYPKKPKDMKPFEKYGYKI